MKREVLSDILNEYGWVYDPKNHYWSKADKPKDYLF
jgi:hypothetical protein